MFLSFCQTRLKRTSMRDAYICNRSDDGSAAWKYTFSIIENFCSLFFFLKKINKVAFFSFSVPNFINTSQILEMFSNIFSNFGTAKMGQERFRQEGLYSLKASLKSFGQNYFVSLLFFTQCSNRSNNVIEIFHKASVISWKSCERLSLDIWVNL